MFAKFTYEDQLKLKTARRLDKIKMAIEERGETIAKDPRAAALVRDNSTQVREIAAPARRAARPRRSATSCRRSWAASETDVGKLLAAFFKIDDGNFRARYEFFYDQLAPSLELYRVRVGDTLTIKAFTKSGLRPVGQPEGLRHLQLQGPREVGRRPAS